MRFWTDVALTLQIARPVILIDVIILAVLHCQHFPYHRVLYCDQDVQCQLKLLAAEWDTFVIFGTCSWWFGVGLSIPADLLSKIFSWDMICNFKLDIQHFFFFLMKQWLLRKLRAGVWSYLGCLEEGTECDDLQDLWQGLCLSNLVNHGVYYLFLHTFLGYVLAHILYLYSNFSQKKFGRANLSSGIIIQASIVFSIYTPAADILSEYAQSILLATFTMLSFQIFADVLYLYW